MLETIVGSFFGVYAAVASLLVLMYLLRHRLDL